MDWIVVGRVAVAASPFLLAAFAGIGWLYKHERERRASAEQQLSERKRKVYLAVLDVYFQMMKGVKVAKPLDENVAAELLFDATAELLLFGSDSVIASFNALRKRAQAGQLRLIDMGDLMIAIRKDMGHLKTTLTADQALAHFVNDYDPAFARKVIGGAK